MRTLQSTATLLLILALTIIGIRSEAQERHEFSLAQSVEYAKKNSAQVKNALLAVKNQAEVNREVTAAAYPSINGTLGATYNPNVATQSFPNFIAAATYGVLEAEGVKDGNGNTIVSPADFGFIQAQFGTKYSSSVGLTLNQLLFDGQVFVGLQARRTTIEWAEKNVEVTEENIKANIHKIYYQLLVSKRQLELLDANIGLVDSLARTTRILYDNGFAEKLDIDKLQVQKSNLQTEMTKALNGIETGYLGLKVLMGMPVKDTLVLTDVLTDDMIKEGGLELGQFNYTDRPDYQYAEISRKLSEFNVRRYKLSQIPTVSLSGAYLKNAQRNKFDFFGRGDWFTISNVNLNINVPIFNGFSTKAKIAQAQIAVQQANIQIDAMKNMIDQEVEAARISYRSALITLDEQKKNMELAEKVYQQTKKKFEVGTGSALEITQSQTELKSAQTNYISALYDAIIAKVDFQKATGKL
ncbi:MAG: TolC family protein [Chitinophagaceae bacterium]|nr:TolC family protein [Chitinophagaceae bacterium]MBN8666828.1 TolC family protein [Chitinophagales bacterium]